MRYRAALIALCVAALAAGCGQRGPLTLPSRGGDATVLPDAAQQGARDAESPSATDAESPAALGTELPAAPDPGSPTAPDAESPADDEEAERDNDNQ